MTVPLPEKVLKRSPKMLPLFARAGAAMLPGASKLPLLGGRGRPAGLPDVALALRGVRVDRDRLAAYDRVCRFPLRDRLPATYPHVLAFALQLSLLSDPSFPFPALGLVHIANRIVQHRPIRLSEELDLTVWAEQLEPHPRGTQFSLRSEARVAGELVWEEVSRLLRRGGPGAAGGEGGAAAGGSPLAEDQSTGAAAQEPASATWRLPGDLGRRYGSVSGDMNPIHLHPLSARPFGFPAAIAHGMWTKGRCLAALDPRLPERFEVEVRFRRPILLPATVEFFEVEEPAGVRFGVRGAGKATPHLDGLIRRL